MSSGEPRHLRRSWRSQLMMGRPDILRDNADLKANNATATFFIIGSQVAGHEHTLQDLTRNGNEPGNHAMHDEPSRPLSDTTLVEQIHSVEGLLNKTYAAVNVEPPSKYFRPGSGLFGERMRQMLGLPNGSWQHLSTRSADSLLAYQCETYTEHVTTGGIIICHGRRRWTAPILT